MRSTSAIPSRMDAWAVADLLHKSLACRQAAHVATESLKGHLECM